MKSAWIDPKEIHKDHEHVFGKTHFQWGVLYGYKLIHG
jgi:hypothetical protein